MESAGKRKRSRSDDSLINAFTALRDSSLVQTGPKRRREGMWFFTPDPPSARRNKRKSTPGKRSQNSSLIKSTRMQSMPDRNENTPHTGLVQTVREFVDAASEITDLVPATSAASHRHQFTPTPVTSTRRSTRSSARRSTELKDLVPETPSTDTNTSQSVLKGLHSITESAPTPNTDSLAEYHSTTVMEQSQTGPTNEPSVSKEDVSVEPPSLPKDTMLEPLETEEEEEEEEDVDHMMDDGRQSDDEENAGEAESGEDDRVADVELSPQADTHLQTSSSQHLESNKEIKRTRQKQTSPAKSRSSKPPKTLPRPLIKNLFTLFSKRRLTKDAMDLVMKFSELYLKQASHDLAAFAGHAGRKTIEVNDVILLLHRQRAVSDKKPFEYLVNTHLPMEYTQELLPCALAGKTVTP